MTGLWLTWALASSLAADARAQSVAAGAAVGAAAASGAAGLPAVSLEAARTLRTVLAGLPAAGSDAALRTSLLALDPRVAEQRALLAPVLAVVLRDRRDGDGRVFAMTRALVDERVKAAALAAAAPELGRERLEAVSLELLRLGPVAGLYRPDSVDELAAAGAAVERRLKRLRGADVVRRAEETARALAGERAGALDVSGARAPGRLRSPGGPGERRDESAGDRPAAPPPASGTPDTPPGPPSEREIGLAVVGGLALLLLAIHWMFSLAGFFTGIVGIGGR